LTGLRISKHIAFNKEPVGVLNSIAIYMFRGQMAGHSEAGPHRSLGVWRDNAQACAGRLVHNDGIAGVDIKFIKLSLVKESVTIIADTTDECAFAAKLRQSNDRIGDRSTADKASVVGVKSLQE